MLSIIIPTYNEERILEKTLDALTKTKPEDVECIVVDGGSQDRTVDIARRYPVTVLQRTANRAGQMNTGAQNAKGDIFLFMHADTVVPPQSQEAIVRSIQDGLIGGCLTQYIESEKKLYHWIKQLGNIRTRKSKTFYGDQGIFVRKDVFFDIGGFDEVEVFEDFLFSKKLKNYGLVDILPEKISISARRWDRDGIIRTTFMYWALTLGLTCNVPLRLLKKIYKDVR